MASRNMMIGTGAALAGLGGLAAAAVTSNNVPDNVPQASTAAQPVETQTVIVRKVEHRIKRIKAHHHRAPQRAATAASPTPVAPAAVQPAPVVQAAPVPVTAPAHNTAPIRTRTSGGGHGASGDDSGEHESGHHSGSDDGGEFQDD